MLFQLNLQPLFDYSPGCFPSITRAAAHHRSVLAFRFSSEWKRQYGRVVWRTPGLDKEISFLFNYNFILCFLVGPQQNKHCPPPGPVFCGPGWLTDLSTAITGITLQLLIILIADGVWGQWTSKWKSWNISHILSSVLVVFPLGAKLLIGNSGDSRPPDGFCGHREHLRENYEWMRGGGEGRVAGAVGGNVSGNFWFCFLQSRITPDWLFMFNQQCRPAERCGVSGSLPGWDINVRYLGWNINIICCSTS